MTLAPSGVWWASFLYIWSRANLLSYSYCANLLSYPDNTQSGVKHVDITDVTRWNDGSLYGVVV